MASLGYRCISDDGGRNNHFIDFNQSSYKYDASVYLSENSELEESKDLKLFDIECRIPPDSDHACGNRSAFVCTYASENNNTLDCASVPMNTEYSLRNAIIDMTSFLNNIPKNANFIYQVCLRNEPNLCDVAVLPAHFY